MIDWVLAPLSGASVHRIEPWAYWHARCMVLGWGVMLPLGALAARYFKVHAGAALARSSWTTRPGGTRTGGCSGPAWS
jgi:hypothetical protein